MPRTISRRFEDLPDGVWTRHAYPSNVPRLTQIRIVLSCYHDQLDERSGLAEVPRCASRTRKFGTRLNSALPVNKT
jgi:hypothetical protein